MCEFLFLQLLQEVPKFFQGFELFPLFPLIFSHTNFVGANFIHTQFPSNQCLIFFINGK